MRIATRSNQVRTIAVVAVIAGFGLGLSTPALAESYTYDPLGRLTAVTSDSGVVTHYCYDAAGNRTYVGPNVCP